MKFPSIHPFKEWSSNQAVIATIIAATLASFILPWVLTQKSFYVIDFNTTGPIGDTIGGIVGPILNFAGLLTVYFSLKEQFTANESQRESLDEERARASRDSAFNTAIRLLDETKNYWLENKAGIGKLLEEEDKLSLYSPESFDHMSEVDDEGFFQAGNEALRTSFSFFEVLQDFIPDLSIQQRKVIFTLFKSSYFRPLSNMADLGYQERAMDAEHYQQHHSGKHPHKSPAREEIEMQIRIFKENLSIFLKQ